VDAFGAYAAGRSQNELETSAKRPQYPASLCARLMVAEIQGLELQKAEHAVRLLRPFMGRTLAKRGESFLRHLSTSERWRILRVRSK
jgi:hypothetical protein